MMGSSLKDYFIFKKMFQALLSDSKIRIPLKDPEQKVKHTETKPAGES